MKKQILKFGILAIFASLLVMSSCKKEVENPEDKENEGEVITSFKITFTDVTAAASTVTASFKDADGDGGTAPTLFETITLKKNTTYKAVIEVLDESKLPAIDLTTEIKNEAIDHLFIFTPSNANVVISIIDKDSNNLPLGIESNWFTGAASTGKVKITLKHQPGIKDGSATPGDTDLELNFDVVVN